jgi:hypothetical protein
MRRAAFKGAFLFVEGPSDEKLYGLFVDQNHCQLIIAHGRTHVIETCRILDKGGFAGFLGIVDADFDHLGSKSVEAPNVFQTDLHDGECSMLSTSAFTKLLDQLAIKTRLAAWKNLHSADVRQHLLQEASTIGYLLWYSNLNDLRLCFQDLDLKDCADSKSLRIDLNLLVKHVKNKSARHDLPDAFLIAGISERMSVTTELWQIVRGHDFIDLFALGLRGPFGNWRALEVPRERLELELRLAYSYDLFSDTRLFRKISDWETAQKTFRVFTVMNQKKLNF